MAASFSTEQAIREIYLKAFESAFKDGKSIAVMTSFNSIGNEWAGSCKGLSFAAAYFVYRSYKKEIAEISVSVEN